jgi:hypothetical protein
MLTFLAKEPAERACLSPLARIVYCAIGKLCNDKGLYF